ncbi:MAG: AAA family ATPase [Olsenella sp.]|jgi:hypothetical protein|nr:AAA family ATPase [Olsenella sp.]
MSTKDFSQDFANLSSEGFPYLYIPTYEEERVVQTISVVIGTSGLVRTPRRLFQWSQTEGLVGEERIISVTTNPLLALNAIANSKEKFARAIVKLQGLSEDAIAIIHEEKKQVIETAKAITPSILWIDMIEKGFSGVRSGGDSGTSTRVFVTFLTWMQEKTAPVFVVTTANDIYALLPELLRMGRFDEIFFVALPTEREREKIFEIHLRKAMSGSQVHHEVSLDEATLRLLASETTGYVGAEIEQIVTSSLYDAFYENRGLRTEDVVKAIHDTVPLSRTQKEQILALHEWAQNRAVLATSAGDREDEVASEERGPDDISGPQGGRIVDFDL